MKKYLLVFLFVPFTVFAQCVGTPNYAPQTTPVGLDNFFVLNAESSFNDAAFSHPSGTVFDVSVMGRDASQQAARKTEAVSFFQSYYGVDFTGGGPVSADGNWFLIHQTVDPRYEQKVVYSGSQMVPTDGWTVHQSYYRMIAMNDFATAFGTWGGVSGKQVLAGTFAEDGEYRFDARIPCETSGFQTSNVDLNYQSIRPTAPDILADSYGVARYPATRAHVDYTINFDPATAIAGEARGRVELQDLGGGDLKAIVRILIKMT